MAKPSLARLAEISGERSPNVPRPIGGRCIHRCWAHRWGLVDRKLQMKEGARNAGLPTKPLQTHVNRYVAGGRPKRRRRRRMEEWEEQEEEGEQQEDEID